VVPFGVTECSLLEDLDDKLLLCCFFFSPSDYCELTADTNTVNSNLRLSENNRTMTWVDQKQPYPDHPERFNHWKQTLCSTGLTGRSYWETEWEGWVYVGVTYRGIKRAGASRDCWFGWNDHSWSLRCSDEGYFFWHNNKRTDISSSSSTSSSTSVSHRVAVYLDHPAGTLSFYRVSSDTLIHLHTFSTTFTEPLYACFRLFTKSSVVLCSL